MRDGDGFEVRTKLNDLKWKLQQPPKTEYYAVQRSARPANAIVPLPLDSGHDRGALDKALKTLRKRLDSSGLGMIRSRDSKLYSARTRSQARRFKSMTARRRVARTARCAALREELKGVRGF